jgi:ribose/xylose/arabinose/galactoside ABC-type transport system permease subunit
MLRLLGASVGGVALVALLATSAFAQPKPVRAGSTVTASVRIVLGGTPARPVRVTCTGTIGGAKVRGVPKATQGKASCTYRTTTAAKGLTLRGVVSFTARGERYVRRFAVRLR